ncbi:MAG: purine-nucleoside phosphorylase [Ignavibacteriales bacterium]|nr:MAG: purine-nucleoside phosphorylase [Ignavibacteriaceae bacterium]MBW7874231.1 purine-nucleoside phosphorylase [Ignavibacteria bacterium]MCZ2142297.1 purine-nucleoside phosphorylase [Ignavibacteriales bacterium]OQY76427.1 MAG: purine-nucleoside phosphorylase [Ignavibacteriales bacterium UTCHB3]MBV6445181.1 Purine nucleoside phosphorylase 1 [Ignavibacteriaceae bacterium]
MIDLESHYGELLDILKKDLEGEVIHLAIVLGSGLGKFPETIKIVKTWDGDNLPNYPRSTVEGHSGKLILGDIEGKKCLVFQGRFHFYEGYQVHETIVPSIITKYLGIPYLLLTNAAGGVNLDFEPGDLMLCTSFLGFGIKPELDQVMKIAQLEDRNNFLKTPDPDFNDIIIWSALEEKVHLKEGVYWYNKGPTYETPAEIRMVDKFGVSAVGMSTVAEAYWASANGVKVSCISCITNYAAGLSPHKLSHEDVTIAAKLVENKFNRLVRRIAAYFE